jgi:hypothetical protein
MMSPKWEVLRIVEQELVECPQPSVDEPSSANEFGPVALTGGVIPTARSPVRRNTTIIIEMNTRLFRTPVYVRGRCSFKGNCAAVQLSSIKSYRPGCIPSFFLINSTLSKYAIKTRAPVFLREELLTSNVLHKNRAPFLPDVRWSPSPIKSSHNAHTTEYFGREEVSADTGFHERRICPRNLLAVLTIIFWW